MWVHLFAFQRTWVCLLLPRGGDRNDFIQVKTTSEDHGRHLLLRLTTVVHRGPLVVVVRAITLSGRMGVNAMKNPDTYIAVAPLPSLWDKLRKKTTTKVGEPLCERFATFGR